MLDRANGITVNRLPITVLRVKVIRKPTSFRAFTAKIDLPSVNPHATYAFYGSLRQGMGNHRQYARGMSFLFTEKVSGYALYAMRYYPYAVKTNNPGDAIVVEVCKIMDAKTETSIHALELSVGYYYDEVMIRDQLTGIYLFEKRGPEPLVKGGDWVKFFGS